MKASLRYSGAASRAASVAVATARAARASTSSPAARAAGRKSDMASVDSTRLRRVATPRKATASGSDVTCRGRPKNDELTSWRTLAASAGSRHTTAAISAAPQLGDSRAAVRSP